MAPAEFEELQDRLCLALYRASNAMTGAYRTVLQPLGLTYPQYVVLSALWQDDELSVKTLSEILELDYGTMSPLLKRLESKGLVKRQRSDRDERSVIVKLEPAGQELAREARPIHVQICRETGLSPEDREALVSQLQQVTAHLLNDHHVRRVQTS